MGNVVVGGWRKASASQSQSNCVEVNLDAAVVHVRNSRDPQGAVLTFTRSEWMAFLDGVARGEFMPPGVA